MSKPMVVKFADTTESWPAFQDERGIIVDLRTWDGERLTYQPHGLIQRGIPIGYVSDAANSEPPGFALLQY